MGDDDGGGGRRPSDESSCQRHHMPVSHYVEIDGLIDKVGALPKTGDACAGEIERITERFQHLIDLYQEQPHLLDAKLPAWFDALLALVDVAGCDLHNVNLTAFAFLAHLTKVRGAKVALRLLPHEVGHLEPVLNMMEFVLEQSDRDQMATWGAEYVLLLWLSVLAKIPFDLSRFDGQRDGSDAANVNKPPTATRMKNLGLAYLVRSDKTQNAAALVLANLLSRADVANAELQSVVRRTAGEIAALSDYRSLRNVWLAVGKCELLARILKHCGREDVLPAAGDILEVFGHMELKELDSSLRKMCTKILQRTGLVLLPTRAAAKWRYRRGKRRLEDTLHAGAGATDGVAHKVGIGSHASHSDTITGLDDAEEDVELENGEEMAPGLELVIERLLTALEDDTTVVRWSAAKGLGRVCNKLPRSLADEVLQSILDIFERLPDLESVWHGASLALAELARRGLVLPDNLDSVVGVARKALTFDRSAGTPRPLISASVRDAACYLCWSLARAFSPDELRRHVAALAPLMVTAAVCDREVNVRRAASAAFQENVGRQRTFPHGIEIVTTVDYFAVGNRQRCYTQLCPFIAKYDEYAPVLVEHLVKHKAVHWDGEIRSQAAQALALIADIAPDLVLAMAVEQLVEKCTSVDVFVRHGALLTVGSAAAALYRNGALRKADKAGVLASAVGAVHSVLAEGKGALLHGAGGQATRDGVNVFVREMAKARIPLTPDDLSRWHKAVCNNTEHTVDKIREGAFEALDCLFAYFAPGPECIRVDSDLLLAWVRHYVEKLDKVSTLGEIGRRGAALALAAVTVTSLPRETLGGIIKCLSTSVSDRDGPKLPWVEATRDCVLALEKLVDKVYASGLHLTREEVACIQGSYTAGLRDYTRDRRGDIGRLVRDASLCAWVKFVLALCEHADVALLDEGCVSTGVGLMLQQCCGKINYTRVIACTQMGQLLKSDKFATVELPHRTELSAVFLKLDADCKKASAESWEKHYAHLLDDAHFWMRERSAFGRLIGLLRCDAYLPDVLLGLIASAGGMGESTQRAAGESLVGHLTALRDDVPALRALLGAFVHVLSRHHGVQRVVAPSLVVLDTLLAADCFAPFNTPHVDDELWLCELSEFVAKESLRKKCVKRVTSGVSVMCALLQFDAHSKLYKSALDRVLLALLHAYPVVRRAAAEKLYEAVLMFPPQGMDDAEVETINEALTTTQWDDDVGDLKGVVAGLKRCFDAQ